MTVSFCSDEHVPSVFVTTLRSNGYEVVTAKDVFGEETDDRRLLEHCAEENHIFVTNDKKDFTNDFADEINHAGIIIYTDPILLRSEPDKVVRTLERILDLYPPEELRGERIWLNHWVDP